MHNRLQDLNVDALREKATELLGSREDVERELKDWVSQLRTYVEQSPAASLGAALSIGVVLGWLLKRR